jgi:hypothetical protein
VTVTVASSVNNYSPTGYAAGVTNRLLLTAASGGSTITGLVAATDGWQIVIINQSATSALTFANQSASSTATNQFLCPNASSQIIAPLAGAIIEYVGSIWMFIS